MNYELAICFLFVLLFIIYFYIRKQPIIEGAGKSKDPFKKLNNFFKKIPKQIKKIPKEAKKIQKQAEKKTLAQFNKAKEATTKEFKKAEKEAKKGFSVVTKELNKVKNTILKPILKFVKQVENFGKNLGRLFVDWANFISSNIMCAIRNVSNPVCLLWNVVRLVAYLFYAIVWLIILSFAGQSTAVSFECIIIKIQDFLGKFLPQILKNCGKGCSARIPLWAGKKMKMPSDNTRKKCNAKFKSANNFEEDNFTSDRTFYWIVAAFLLAYKIDLPNIINEFIIKLKNQNNGFDGKTQPTIIQDIKT